MAVQTLRTTCVIAGGGPAGMVLGLLLARRGIRVTVIEKHRDFLRDFRGDTVHPSTLRLLDDLGLFARFDRLPQSHVRQLRLPTEAGPEVVVADLTRLPTPHPYIAMVPQWDLLDLLAEAASAEPTFTLLREHEVTGVLRGGGSVRGLTFRSPEGDGEVRADLTVAADGRWSTVRRALDLPLREFPVPFDVWWFRITTDQRLADVLLPRIRRGRIGIPIPRRGYVQVAWIARKGTDAALRAAGIDAFRADVAELLPDLAGDTASIATMDDVKHLDVRVDRLRRWHANGVVCIGDAAHAMSPAGGVGINLAVQDAVAAARLLAGPLRRGSLAGPRSGRLLARVQRRRRLPTAVMQSLQRLVHSRAIAPVIEGRNAAILPRAAGILLRIVPGLSVIPAFLVGIGPRPERAPRWARR
ncbi:MULTISPECIES: FAD-dependent oxidoreductase [Microbacterium]|uniref:FAD-dependent oxidoreductase n=1 Tax=Microbacterium TaxID=33882 RepID=UPI002786944D|nr:MULTISPECIES: FAD-dependent oxidoreductase [Microbacterium]MDQ1082420.1 2-polyprenyl-6-methoxyphenol hydroxylase-like FAD-dependent oxidoreductase [Microbacterium sp. SORGH_AS_0344]MDQ1168809.1 2-polyprenyl-6-methoxyphenol hydroxylase-like FAD-dependent oxidoreductase [Microbacterium proteolyticum]